MIVHLYLRARVIETSARMVTVRYVFERVMLNTSLAPYGLTASLDGASGHRRSTINSNMQFLSSVYDLSSSIRVFA